MDTETALTRLLDQRRVKGLARGEQAALAEKLDGLQLTESRVEVVAERWNMIRLPSVKDDAARAQGRQRGPERSKRSQPTAPAKPAPVSAQTENAPAGGGRQRKKAAAKASPEAEPANTETTGA